MSELLTRARAALLTPASLTESGLEHVLGDLTGGGIDFGDLNGDGYFDKKNVDF
ncbi:MAG: hypothetical protein HC809_04880 [Gammaproteobacteria bacterium]|nr:hypothetical protein [Gammaproteobacteria bacterium]